MEAITRYITEKLNEHPDEMSRQYEVGLTKMIMAGNPPLTIGDVLGLINDPNSPDDLRYACFVMATIWYRHMKDMENFENLICRYQDQLIGKTRIDYQKVHPDAGPCRTERPSRRQSELH